MDDGAARPSVRRPPAPPVGFHRFHRNRFFNYQLNRFRSFGGLPLEDVAAVGRRIRTMGDAQRELARSGERAAADGRLAHAAFWYRGAEFFAPPHDPAKVTLYDRCLESFDAAFADGVERDVAPYASGALPLLRVGPTDRAPRGTVLVHGGFDSLIEEFVALYLNVAAAGYEVVAFDGPGQGGALRRHGLAFDHDWEKPTGAVLDHLGRDGVTLWGLSMGGYWCLRAAAFEPRVHRVVVMPAVYDWMAGFPRPVVRLVRGLAARRRFMNATIRLRMRLLPVIRHAIDQGLMQIDGDEPADVPPWLLHMHAGHQHPERVVQDVLLLAGAKDRFQPRRLHDAQRRALGQARSVTARVFTEEEHGADHCQVGNLGLAIAEVTTWLDRLHAAQP